MDHSARQFNMFKLALGLMALTLVTACGGGGAGGVEAQDQPQSDAPITTGTAEFTPTPGNGLDIAFADGSAGTDNSAFIEAQWMHMQTCLQVSAQEPVVSVVQDRIAPLDSNDDVIRHIDGQILASSHVDDSSAAIQVRAQDFDGSFGEPGNALRSILGRYLWLANNLDERDYPYECANGS